MNYPLNNITPRAIKKKATNDTTSPSFLVFLSSESSLIYIPFMNKKALPNIIAIPNIFVSIPKLKKQLKFFEIFFYSSFFRFLRSGICPTQHKGVRPTLSNQQSRSRDLLNNSDYRGEMPCLNQIFNVVLQCVNTRDYPKPYWDFSYIVLWGVGISNDLNDLCRTPPHIITSVNTGGQKWLH